MQRVTAAMASVGHAGDARRGAMFSNVDKLPQDRTCSCQGDTLLYEYTCTQTRCSLALTAPTALLTASRAVSRALSVFRRFPAFMFQP